jgi:hypothetical protein
VEQDRTVGALVRLVGQAGASIQLGMSDPGPGIEQVLGPLSDEGVESRFRFRRQHPRLACAFR